MDGWIWMGVGWANQLEFIRFQSIPFTVCSIATGRRRRRGGRKSHCCIVCEVTLQVTQHMVPNLVGIYLPVGIHPLCLLVCRYLSVDPSGATRIYLNAPI